MSAKCQKRTWATVCRSGKQIDCRPGWVENFAWRDVRKEVLHECHFDSFSRRTKRSNQLRQAWAMTNFGSGPRRWRGAERHTSGGARETTQHRYADDRRYRVERFRCLFWGRRSPWASNAKHRSNRQRGCHLHQLVRSGKLYCRARIIHHWPHPNQVGTLNCGCSG